MDNPPCWIWLAVTNVAPVLALWAQTCIPSGSDNLPGKLSLSMSARTLLKDLVFLILYPGLRMGEATRLT
jgi:hypothetical protein